MYCENQDTIKPLKNFIFHIHSKHIEMDNHFVRERILEREIELQYIPTSSQLANILTKPLDKRTFEFYRSAIGVIASKFLYSIS